MKRILFHIVLSCIALAATSCSRVADLWNGKQEAKFRTETITREDLVTTITATGTVEPEDVVDVGAQVAGKIDRLGAEASNPEKTIDFGSVVEQGMVLAMIDDKMYKAQVAQAQASLARAKADVRQMDARLLQAKREWERAQELMPQKAIALTDYDLAKSNFQAAEANLGVGQAVVDQAQAMLDIAQTNLDYTVIKSPVRGTIIARRVNVGQTVVASLNAPSLFLIAKDLHRMEVWVSVNEADIGRIRVGMPVQFTVDAYPDDVFHGTVDQIRLNAQMTQNVVLYTVVVNAPNPELKLLPYLTANLKFEVETRKAVLQVPNAALRWHPRTAEMVVPEEREKCAAMLAAKEAAKKGGPRDSAKGEGGRPGNGSDHGKMAGDRNGNDKPANGGELAGSPAKGKPKDADASKDREDRGRIWIKDGQYVRPIDVAIGATDGFFTEVSGEGLEENQEVVISEIRQTADSDATNPFMPKSPFGRRH